MNSITTKMWANITVNQPINLVVASDYSRLIFILKSIMQITFNVTTMNSGNRKSMHLTDIYRALKTN